MPDGDRPETDFVFLHSARGLVGLVIAVLRCAAVSASRTSTRAAVVSGLVASLCGWTHCSLEPCPRWYEGRRRFRLSLEHADRVSSALDAGIEAPEACRAVCEELLPEERYSVVTDGGWIARPPDILSCGIVPPVPTATSVHLDCEYRTRITDC